MFKIIKLKALEIMLEKVDIDDNQSRMKKTYQMQKARQEFLTHVNAPAESYPTYVLGDLNGNAMKLLVFLMVCGLVDITDRYEKLLKSYADRNYKDFLQDLSALKFNASMARLILIGDTLCDRGESDYMTLMVYKRMHDQHVNYTIIFSNHDSFAMMGCIHGFDQIGKNLKLDANEERSFDYAGLDQNQKKDFDTLYVDNYLNHLTLLDYDVVNDKNEPRLVIYSHAPISTLRIRKAGSAIIDLLGGINSAENQDRPQKPNVIDDEYLKKVIEYISSKFKKWIADPKANEKHLKYFFDPNSALYELIWNRKVEPLDAWAFNIYGHNAEGNRDRIGVLNPTGQNIASNRIDLDSGMGRPAMPRINPSAPIKTAAGFIQHLHGAGLQNKGLANEIVIDFKQMLLCKLQPGMEDKDKLVKLTEMIRQAVEKYAAWYKGKGGTDTKGIGVFTRHGPDGQKRAKRLLELATASTTHKQVYGHLKALAKGEITKDSAGNDIDGKIRISEHSFASFLFNEFKSYPPLYIKLGLADIDYTEKHSNGNALRQSALEKMKQLS